MMRPTRSTTDLEAAEMSRRNKAFQRESANEQVERAKKTARLRALSLAKEAADRKAAESVAADKAAAKAKVPAKKKRLIKRGQATENSAAAIPDAGPAGS